MSLFLIHRTNAMPLTGCKAHGSRDPAVRQGLTRIHAFMARGRPQSCHVGCVAKDTRSEGIIEEKYVETYVSVEVSK